MKRLLAILLLFHFFYSQGFAQIERDELQVNPEFGVDSNTGQKENPLRSLREAALRINTSEGEGAVTVFLSEGMYVLDTTVRFEPTKRKFTRKNRLSIRAEVLPEATKLFGQFDMNRGKAINKCFEHQTHHRGQTTVYIRLAGATPPQEKLF